MTLLLISEATRTGIYIYSQTLIGGLSHNTACSPRLLASVIEMVFAYVCVCVHHMLLIVRLCLCTCVGRICFYHRLCSLSSLISLSSRQKMFFTLEPLLRPASYYHNEIEKKLKWKRLPPGDSVHDTGQKNGGKAQAAKAAVQDLRHLIAHAKESINMWNVDASK